MRLFSKAKPKTTPRDAILGLREQLEVIEKKEKFIQSKLDKELQIAKLNATKNKRVALMALKRSKKYEADLERYAGFRMTMETHMSAVEDASFNMEAMNAVRTGAQALKSIHGELDMDKVDTIFDDIREQTELANEVSTVLSQPMTGVGVDYDDEELLDELRTLEQEELDSRLLGVESTPVSKAKEPVAAQVPRPTRETELNEDEEKELEMLKASMAM